MADRNVSTENDKWVSSGSDIVLRSEGATTADFSVNGEKAGGVDEKAKGKMPMEVDEKANGRNSQTTEEYSSIASNTSSYCSGPIPSASSVCSGEASCYPSESYPSPSESSSFLSVSSCDTTESSDDDPSEPSCDPMNLPHELKKPMLDRRKLVIEDEARKQKVASWVDGTLLKRRYNRLALQMEKLDLAGSQDNVAHGPGGQETGKQKVTSEEAGNTPKRRKKRGAIQKEKLVWVSCGRRLSARAGSEDIEMTDGNKGVDGSEADEKVKGKESSTGSTTDVMIETPNRGDNSDEVKAVTSGSAEIEEGEIVESDEEKQKGGWERR